MLSICIPIYNCNVTELVTKLYNQYEKIGVSVEIICIDDCSDFSFRKKNEEICSKYGKYVQLDKNIGRSKIRNLFLKYVNQDYLLFMDCDSAVISEIFLLNYVEAIKQNNSPVICGGRIYGSIKPEKTKLLRWKYGTYRESQPYEIRYMNPNKSFMTNNFAIRKDIFAKLQFDERLSQYGHEDTLFGFQLKKNNISVLHINNPVLNNEIENNSDYLKKTEAGLINLTYILEFVGNNPELINDISILKFYSKCKKTGLLYILYPLFLICGSLINKLLSKGFANLFLFDFYKLGYFAVQMKKKKEIISNATNLRMLSRK